MSAVKQGLEVKRDALEGMLLKLQELNLMIEEAKHLYEERDKLVMSLQSMGFTQAAVDGVHFTLKDNFAEKNTAWRMAAVNRFEIVVKKDKS